MKRLICLLFIPFLLLSGCNRKKYNYNKEFYEPFNLHYVKQCEKFIRRVNKDKDCDVCFLGDSITEGYDVKNFFPEYKVVNRGISGDFTNGVIDRLEFCVYDLNPKIVYLMIGTNNLDSCTGNYEAILKLIKEHCPETKVMVLSITPRRGDDLMDKIRKNNIEIQKFAENQGYFYVNAFTPMTENNENLVVNESLFMDGLHPNNDGYKVLTDLVKPTIIEWLK